jgi:NADH-quinone oxidoreductase subunit G
MVEQIIEAIDEDKPSHAKDIASTLLAAKRPLIISGTSLRSPNILKVSANLAAALARKNPSTGIFLCASEVNSVGVAMIDNTGNAEDLLGNGPETVIVLENDIDTRLGSALLDEVQNLVVIDAMDNPTASRSSIVLPAASFAEAEGTFVNNEGRAQRSMATFTPAGDITPGYQLLSALGGDHLSASGWQQKLAAEHASLAGVVTCAPDEQFRIDGSRIARMTHRASGRTAVLANVSVHEPQQPLDTESPLAFTMEGNQARAPASLRPYTWSPGWNSNQSIHKFQDEVGGPDKSGTTGIRLFTGSTELTGFELSEEADANLIGQVHIFGSDELSNEAAELSTLIPQPYARMSSATAASLEVSHQDGLAFGDIIMTVLVDDQVAERCVVYPMIPGTEALGSARLSGLQKVAGYTAPSDPLRPSLITTDRTS